MLLKEIDNTNCSLEFCNENAHDKDYLAIYMCIYSDEYKETRESKINITRNETVNLVSSLISSFNITNEELNDRR